MSLSYSFPYAASTIYAAVDTRGRLTVEHRSPSSPQEPTAAHGGAARGGMVLHLSPSATVPLVRAWHWFRFRSAANVALYGMHFDSCPWRLQGLLRQSGCRLGLRSVLQPDVPTRTHEYLAVMGRGCTLPPTQLIGLARFDGRNAWNLHHHGRFDSLSQPGPDRIHHMETRRTSHTASTIGEPWPPLEHNRAEFA